MNETFRVVVAPWNGDAYVDEVDSRKVREILGGMPRTTRLTQGISIHVNKDEKRPDRLNRHHSGVLGTFILSSHYIREGRLQELSERAADNWVSAINSGVLNG